MNEIMTVHSPDPQTPEMQMQTEIEHLKDKVYNLTRERDAAVRDWQQAAEGSGSFDSCGACTHRKYDNTDGIYCDIRTCHPEWLGPEPGKEYARETD